MNKKIKLSPTQERVLRAMGKNSAFWDKPSNRWFICGEAINSVTLQSLYRFGLVEENRKSFAKPTVITPAGRKYLEEHL